MIQRATIHGEYLPLQETGRNIKLTSIWETVKYYTTKNMKQQNKGDGHIFFCEWRTGEVTANSVTYFFTETWVFGGKFFFSKRSLEAYWKGENSLKTLSKGRKRRQPQLPAWAQAEGRQGLEDELWRCWTPRSRKPSPWRWPTTLSRRWWTRRCLPSPCPPSRWSVWRTQDSHSS